MELKQRCPPPVAYGPTYVQTKRLLARTEAWPRERLERFRIEKLRALLVHCGAHVPYYRELFGELRFDPARLRDIGDLAALPLMDKDFVRANGDRLLAENIPRRKLRHSPTGGTTGEPLELWNLEQAGARERAFIHTVWRRAGFRPRHTRAMLRGVAIHEPPHWRYDAEEQAHVYSNLYLTPENAGTFARAMLQNGNVFLHSYPSSLALFARYAEEQRLELPRFRAILTSSEQLTPAQRRRLETFYRCRVFEWYGHSENLILAAQCELSDLYHVVPEYGVAEVVAADGSRVKEEGAEGELVGTTLYNYAMPLVRYRTGDWATLGPRAPCACGRAHALLAEVSGRRDAHLVVTRTGSLIPLLAVDPYTSSFDRVARMQFVQERPGELELRLVRGAGYTDADTNEILAKLRELLGPLLDVRLTFCDEIPLTARGKHRLLVQRLSRAGGTP